MFLLSILSFNRLTHHKYSECETCKKEFYQLQHSKIDYQNYFTHLTKTTNNEQRKIIEKLGKKLFNQTLETKPESICEIMGKCRPKLQPLSVPDQQLSLSYKASLHEHGDDDPDGNCQYCKNIFDFLTGEALQDTTVPIFSKLIKVMCDNLPPASAICEHVTNHHVEKLIMLVTSKFENRELCQSAGLCQNNN